MQIVEKSVCKLNRAEGRLWNANLENSDSEIIWNDLWKMLSVKHEFRGRAPVKKKKKKHLENLWNVNSAEECLWIYIR